MSTIADFYKGKRVLVTGHTGFKGAWLCSWLTKMGSDVCGYALEPSTEPSLFNILKLKEHANSVIADIRDYCRLHSVLEEFRPDLIFHLAAQALVRRSYREPRLTFETNMMGIVNLLEAVRKTGCARALVNVTSDKCYENREWVWGYRENDRVGGKDSYSASKGAAELITASYRRSFFENSETAVATARSGNVIGGGDWAEDRLVPDIVRSLSQGKEIAIRNPGAVRPWQHVLEPLSGYLLLGKLLYEKGQEYAEAWNFGPHEVGSLSVEDLVRKSVEIWGGGSYRVESRNHLPEAMILRLDVSKAIHRLDWRPQMTSEDAVEKTIGWYVTYYRNEKTASKMVKEQIEEYSEQITM